MSSQMEKTSLLAILAVACSVCAAEPALVTLQDFASAHKFVQLVEGGAWSNERRYTLADRDFVIEVRKAQVVGGGVVHFELAQQLRFKLDPVSADETWLRIAKLGIFDWRAHYAPEDLGQSITDGIEWSVRYREGRRKKESSGVNAFPGLFPIGAPVLAPDFGGPKQTAYHDLIAIFEVLEKKSNQSTDPTLASGTPAAEQPARHS